MSCDLYWKLLDSLLEKLSAVGSYCVTWKHKERGLCHVPVASVAAGLRPARQESMAVPSRGHTAAQREAPRLKLSYWGFGDSRKFATGPQLSGGSHT